MILTDFTRKQRAKPRERIEFPLKVILLDNEHPTSEEFDAEVVDVSEDGIGFKTPGLIPPSKDVLCVFETGEKRKPECLIGTLVWRSKNETSYHYGLRFGGNAGKLHKDFLDKVRKQTADEEKKVKPQPPAPTISDEAILQVARYIGVSDMELSRIKPIDKKFVHKSDPNQVVIGEIFNADEYAYEVEELRPHAVFYTHAYPNLRCPIAFDHPLDHYPMMAMFEIPRQMALAIMHLFYQVPLDGYIAIVKWTIFNYKEFAELDLPLAVIAVDTAELDIGAKIQQRSLQFFYIQENRIVATMQSDFSSLKQEFYQRIRKSARRSKLLSRFGKVEEVKFVSNVEATSLFAPRNNFV